jgi:hypothetical protein
VVAAADEEVQVGPADREAGRGERAGAAVLVVEAVGQAGAEEPGDAALRRDVAGRGTVAERVAGRGPGAVGRALEAVVEVALRRRVLAELVVGGEGGAVEVADEVLRPGAAGVK